MLRHFTYFAAFLALATGVEVYAEPPEASIAAQLGAGAPADAMGRADFFSQKRDEAKAAGKTADAEAFDQLAKREYMQAGAESAANTANAATGAQAKQGGGEGGGGGGAPLIIPPAPQPPQQQQNSGDNKQQTDPNQAAMQQQIQQLQQQISDNKNAKSTDTTDPAQKADEDRLATLMAQINAKPSSTDGSPSDTKKADPNADLAANDQKILQMVQDEHMKVTQSDLNNDNSNTNSNSNSPAAPSNSSPFGLAFNQGNATAAFQGGADAQPGSEGASGAASNDSGGGSNGGPTGGSGNAPVPGALTTTMLASTGIGGSQNGNSTANSSSNSNASSGGGLLPETQPNSVPTLPKGTAGTMNARQITPANGSNSSLLNMLWSIRRPSSTTNPLGTILGASAGH